MRDSKSKAIAKKSAEPEYSSEQLHHHWSTGKPLSHKGKDYGVHKMSYGDHFLQPYDKKHPEGRGEKSTNTKGEIWLRKDSKVNQYGVKQHIYRAE